LYLLGLVSDLHFHSILEHKIGFPLYWIWTIAEMGSRNRVHTYIRPVAEAV
jgi:hypothetical protein